MRKSDIFEYFGDADSKPKPSNDTFVAILPKGISNLEDLFNTLSKLLFFPDYFGNNWNAVSDCLRDLDWLAEKNVVLFHEELPRFSENDLWQYIDVLYECIKSWGKDEEHKLVVMFPERCRAQIVDKEMRT